MTRVYLIRHAEAEGNLYRVAQGQYNSILTQRGQQQVQALEARFQDVPVDAVYASDLYRASATACAVSRPKGLPLHRRQDLREICIGEWEEKTWGEIERTEPEQLVNFTHHLERWQVAGAESPYAVRERMLHALREIVAENPDRTVAIVSHGCALRILLGTLQGFSMEEIGKTPHGDNTGVSLVEAEGDQFRVVFRDDNTHLAGGLSIFGKKTANRRANALEPGLYFQPMEGAALSEWMASCVGADWASCGTAQPYDPALLKREAGQRPTLAAIAGETPVGLIQLHPDKEAEEGCGWISLYCMDRPFRGQGLGIQLLGQAVRYYRPLGRERLRLRLGRGNQAAARFFSAYGFAPAGEDGSGRLILEKSIGFAPL